jgi:TadE-like protein
MHRHRQGRVPPSQGKRTLRRHRRNGQAVLEFALIAIVLYLFFAAIIEFGRLLHGAQTVQTIVDQAAREISRVPLPSTTTFAEALTDPRVQAIYSEDYLAIDLSGWTNSSQTLLDYLQSQTPSVPMANQAMLPLMIFDTVGGKPLLRFPGALVTSSTAPSGYTVKVPLVTEGSPPGGPEVIEWHDVMEEVQDSSGNGPFSVSWVDSSGTNPLPGGMVALRLNYAFEAATMAGYQAQPLDANGETTPNLSYPIVADDGGVTAVNSPNGGGTPVAPDLPPPDAQSGAAYAGPYGGEYGLGEMGLQLQTVRPFRKVISAQAIFRREVFGS